MLKKVERNNRSLLAHAQLRKSNARAGKRRKKGAEVSRGKMERRMRSNKDGERYRSRRSRRTENEMGDRAGWRKKGGDASCAWRTRSTSWRTYEECERERAILMQQGQRRPCATSESRVTRGWARARGIDHRNGEKETKENREERRDLVLNTRAARVAHGSSERTHARQRWAREQHVVRSC